MPDNIDISNGRLLVIDDNPAIHEDFRKIFNPGLESEAALAGVESALFGETTSPALRPEFRIDSAFQGQEGVALVRQAQDENHPYALAFVDVRMPPGWDGIETTTRIWEQDPDVQIVICTAYSDHTWDDIREKLGYSDRLIILKKPFDNVEVLQLASSLTEKWRLGKLGQQILEDLENKVALRTSELSQLNRALQAEVDAHKLVEEALRQQQTELRVLLDLIPAMIWFKDTENRILRVNKRVAEAVGKSVEEIEGESSLEIFSQDAAKLYADDLEVIRSGSPRLGIVEKLRDQAGKELWLQTDKVPYCDKNGNVVGIVVVAQNITETKNYEQQQERLASYDPLTGLANHNLLQDRLKQALAQMDRRPHMLAVLFLNLDHFKWINDNLGHSVGDELLKVVAERLKSSVRESDTIARIGGDEFVILLLDQTNEVGISKVALRLADTVSSLSHMNEIVQNILGVVSQPVVLKARELIITCSIGLSLFPQDGKDVETLLKNADAAMSQAKALGRNSFQFYTAELNARNDERLSLQTMLRHALEREEFVLYYQPKVDIGSRQVSDVEALIRWNSRELGLIQPGRFIPVLEETGMIIDVGKWVIRQALLDYKQWLAEGRQPPRIAVNITSLQLGQSNFVDMIKELISDSESTTVGLDMEVTESMIMNDTESNILKLKAIREMGVRIAIDDFGTGYSSLSYLAKLPIDALKIDRAFIINLATNTDDFTIVSAIISLAHSLKLKVIAEGVETEEQSKFLKQLNCDQIQGYIFSRPLPAKEFWEWHERFTSRTPAS